MSAVLEARNIVYSYSKKVLALNGAYAKVFDGKITVVLGPNGSGKTTLLLIMAGLLKPESGEVLFKGKDLWKQLKEARRNIGIVFQDPEDQLFNPRVFDELAFGLRQLGLSEEEVRKRVIRIAKNFGIEELLERSPLSLSYGEKKIITIASILATEPSIILLDEPFANLGTKYKSIVVNIIKKYKEHNKAILLATHDVLQTIKLADYIYILNNGQTIYEGKKEDIILNREIFKISDLEDPCEVIREAIEIIKTLNSIP